jgi:hypothetical protein
VLDGITIYRRLATKETFQTGGTMLQTQVLAATPHDEDLGLVHASKKGDLTAFAELVKRYDRRLLRIAQNVVHDFNDAQEVVQVLETEGNQVMSLWGDHLSPNELHSKLNLS